jgi:CheY-like chemotaxis protein
MADQITLLLVEDEPLVLLAAQDTLEDGGYEVLPATTGAQAIEHLDQQSDAIAGLVTDVRLGDGPNGWDVARHARSLNAGMPVVYVSGDAAEEWAVEGVPMSVLIEKPYAQAQIVTAISELLNESG